MYHPLFHLHVVGEKNLYQQLCTLVEALLQESTTTVWETVDPIGSPTKAYKDFGS